MQMSGRMGDLFYRYRRFTEFSGRLSGRFSSRTLGRG